MNNKKLLAMKGFPNSILEPTWSEMPLINPGNFQRVLGMIKDTPQTIYLYKDMGVSIDYLLHEGTPITDFRAVDYAEFFSYTLADGTYTVAAPILYIYNVGVELSNSTEFSDKVLHKLVQHNKAAGNTTIITSDYYNSTSFVTKYSMSAQLVDIKLSVIR